MGSDLVLASRQEAELQKVAEGLLDHRHAPKVLVEPMDVTRAGDTVQAVRGALESLGSIDILINNAGVGAMDLLSNFDSDEEIERVVRTNLEGAIRLTRAVLPHMMARRNGHIIQVASAAAWIGIPSHTLYAASKFGLRGFSEALRREVSPWGIHVSSVYPGPVKTGFGNNALRMRRVGPSAPGWLSLTADEVARGIARLALRPRRTLIMPGILAPAVWLNQLLPGPLDWLMRLYMQRRGSEKG
jgi:short-subunit dehydrogenase